jgi:hypothetical protein
VAGFLGKAMRAQAVLWLAKKGGDAWGRLSAEDRSRLQSLAAKSRGRPSNLTAAEREELKAISRRARGKHGA